MPRRLPMMLTGAGLLLALALPPQARGDGLPPDAAAVVAEYQRTEAAIRARADAELAPVREKSAQKLKALQDQYTKAAKLDQAVAIRDAIRALRNIRPDPGTLQATAQEIGQVMLFDVVGSTAGSIWGTEVYTTDSHLGTAAVHAGLLKPGQSGVVKVRIVQGQQGYRGTTQNQVTSQPYGPWGVSFTFEPFKESSP